MVAKTFEIEQVNTHSDVRDTDTRWGVYAYIRKSDDKVMYVGKDSWINKGNRRSTHQQYSRMNDQALHPKLLKHKDDLTYQVIAIAKDAGWMEDIEASLIFNLKAVGQCEWNIDEEAEVDTDE